MAKAAASVVYTTQPIYGPLRPVGNAPEVPGTPGGLPDGLPHATRAPGIVNSPSHRDEQAEASRVRVRVRLPYPRHAGAPEFYGGIPKRSSTFGWSELCATREPESSLAPVPQTGTKTWYNSYVYVPPEHTHHNRQFLDRFVQGPDGEWIDVTKAGRLSSYIQETREKAMEDQMERAMVAAGSGVQKTGYTDAYSGESLVACRGELLPQQLLAERSARCDYLSVGRQWADDVAKGFEFDNLRIPWPFDRPYQNKQISQHAYDWFDRQNPYIPSDRSFEFVELPSMFMDKEHYDRWGANAGVAGYSSVYPGTAAENQRVTYVQM